VDSGRIAQVLRNLLDNALAYTPEGGTITVEAHIEESEILVSVHDTGTGIDPDKLPHVFERFYRADPSRARKTGGTGLGLAIVKQWVEAHGGHVWVESLLPGKGCTFNFALPIGV
jgi:signal transduction histidine kinase